MLPRVSSSAMGDGGGGPGILNRIFRTPVRAVGVAASVVALVVSALTGGLEPAKPPGPPEIAAKTKFAGKPWNVTVNGAGYATKVDSLHPEKEGDHWIAVGATVEITAAETRTDIIDALRLVDIPGLRKTKPELGYAEPSTWVLGRDGKELGSLQPGLPEKLLFFWEIDPTVSRPVQADVQIVGKTLRADSLTGHQNWLDDEVKAHVVLPIQDLDKL
jgi:hypothetical protein